MEILFVSSLFLLRYLTIYWQHINSKLQSSSLSASSMILVTIESLLRAFKLFCNVWILAVILFLCYSISLGSPKDSKIDSWFNSLNKTIWSVSWLCLTKKKPMIFGTVSLRTCTNILKYPSSLSLISLMNKASASPWSLSAVFYDRINDYSK